MNKSLSWKNTSLKMDSENSRSLRLVEILSDKGISLRQDDLVYTLENHEHYYILEDEFINQSRNFSLIIKKYSDKNYEELGQIYVPDTEEFRDIKANSKDRKTYENITKENIIDADIREFPISLNILNEVFDDDNQKSTLVLDIFILLALANKSTFSAEEIESVFRIEDKSYKISLNLDSKPLCLFPLYDWVVNDEEYEESYNVKLHVMRQVIINRKDISDVDEVLEDSKLAYKRIISKKTNEYFDQLNQLKDDFLVLSKNENNALRTLNLTFFAWLGYLGIELFKIITNYTGQDIINYLIFSKGPKKGIVILMFIIALFFIFFGYFFEIKSLGKTYDVIKRIYKDKILFEADAENENKFESNIKKPEVGKLQKFLFTVILLILFARFLITFPW